jgi:hypothetical protein
MNRLNRQTTFYLIAALLLPAAALVGLVLRSPSRLVYDERYHLGLSGEIEAKGWRQGLLSDQHQSAAGPLYSALQLAARPLTRLQPPAIRWINVLCLAGTVAALAWWLRRATNASPWWACQILAVPFLWPGVGMALTELPALFAFTIFGGCAALILASPSVPTFTTWAYAIGGGLALGAAVLGRQTYLVAVPAVFVTAIYFRQRMWPLLSLAAIAVITSGWLFGLWGGLVPEHLAHADAGLRPEYALLGLTYLGIAAAFIAPANVLPRKWAYLAVIVVVSLAATAALYAYFFYVLQEPLKPPAAGLIKRLVGPQLAGYVGFLPRWLMTAAGILWLWVTLADAWRRRHEPAHVFLVLSLLALAAAPAKVSHLFSSRYVIGALSLMVVQFAQPAPPRWTEALRSVIGTAIGAGILWSYYGN